MKQFYCNCSIRVFCSLLYICALSYGAFAQEDTGENPFQYYGKAMEAYGQKNYPAYLEYTSKIVGPDTKLPALLYQLAGAYALNNKPAEAIAYLNKLAQMGLAYPVSTDADFAQVREAPGFYQVLQQFEKNTPKIQISTQAFILKEKDLVPEGIAYDAQHKQWYVGSIYKRKIVRIDAQGKATDFTSEGQDGLLGVLGMKVDTQKGILWVCSAALAGDTSGRSGIFTYDTNTGKLLKKYMLEGGAQKHLLNDIVLHPGGDVYATNSKAGAVYKIPQTTGQLEVLVQPNTFIYPNGIALSADGKQLYVAHFAGISSVNLATNEIKELTHPATMTLAGVDGLYLYQNTLLAVQNGVMPHRIVRMYLNKAQTGVDKLEVLEANHPLFEKIPTTGTVAGDTFYFIANSQLRSLGEDGTILPMDQLQEPVILKLTLQEGAHKAK